MLIVGWISGAAGIIVGSPLDVMVLQARLQAPKSTTMTTEPLPTAWQTLTRMVKVEGVSSKDSARSWFGFRLAF
ncbi:hypothetical protein BJV82DRAFT_614983 [Fennellomyces sp. T-0311]|nr:hypothetical protein BJV82DRAFT_614983 [Fennellomyces sp. T-0311]